MFNREGTRHTVYVNPTARKVSTVPRHREINEFMAKKICREREIDLYATYKANFSYGIYIARKLQE